MADALDSLRLMRTQERPEQVFVRGQGSWLWDSDGRAFLDFTQGLAVNCLGHSPSVLVQALARQARELVSAGPGLLNRPVLALAQRLCLATGSDQAYFLTSGAEANEAAIALARKWGRLHRGGAQRIVSTVNSIHGRTSGTLTACGKPAQHGLEGFARVPFNDLDAMAAAIDEETVAVMLEPVQGDAGVIPATLDYLRGIERLCRQRGVLLILDEVQTGTAAAARCWRRNCTGYAPTSLPSARASAPGCRCRRCWRVATPAASNRATSLAPTTATR